MSHDTGQGRRGLTGRTWKRKTTHEPWCAEDHTCQRTAGLLDGECASPPALERPAPGASFTYIRRAARAGRDFVSFQMSVRMPTDRFASDALALALVEAYRVVTQQVIAEHTPVEQPALENLAEVSAYRVRELHRRPEQYRASA